MRWIKIKKLKNYNWRILSAILTGVILILFYILHTFFKIQLPVSKKDLSLKILVGISVVIIILLLYPNLKLLTNNIKKKIDQLSIKKILLILFSLLLGVLLAYSMSKFILLPFFSEKTIVFINIIIIIITMYIILCKEEEIDYILFKESNVERNDKYYSESSPKIIDTSAIIDGRIFEVYKNNFIDGILIVPRFVLEELQNIADSDRELKRKKGRLGLEILKKLQNDLVEDIVILDREVNSQEVDHKLVHLAKELNADLISSDYNLNQLAELQGIKVININRLANALKPVLLPGEKKKVEIIKRGKEQGQGIAYLKDGTMIVVEGGQNHIGEKINVVISSFFQKNSGRMYFANLSSENI